MLYRRLLIVTAVVLPFATLAQMTHRMYLPTVYNMHPTPTLRPGEATPTWTPRPTRTPYIPPSATPTDTSTPTETDTPTATDPPTATVTRTPVACDPAYPDVCIPPPPPDLDCRDIEYRNFVVILDDPHKFDIDFDGIGCEVPPTATGTAATTATATATDTP